MNIYKIEVKRVVGVKDLSLTLRTVPSVSITRVDQGGFRTRSDRRENGRGPLVVVGFRVFTSGTSTVSTGEGPWSRER